MELHATRNPDGTQTLAVVGAAPGSVIELRFQNTMNGLVTVVTADVDAHGDAPIHNGPMNFGHNFAITARVNGDLVAFMTAPDSTDKLLKFVEPNKPVATAAPAQH